MRDALRVGVQLLIFSVLSLAYTNGALARQSPAEHCYAVADNDGLANPEDVLTRVDRLSGVTTTIGRTGTRFIEGIAYSPFRHELLAVNADTLGSLSLVDGTFTAIGPAGHGEGTIGDRHFLDIDGLTFDPLTGVLYGSVRKQEASLLIQINPTTGRFVDHAFGVREDYVVIGPTRPDATIDDIAVHPNTGELYAVESVLDAPSRLLRLDKITGLVQVSLLLTRSEIEGLSFDAEGTLLGVVGAGDRTIVQIDPVTGETVDLFTLGDDTTRDFEALACLTQADTPEPNFQPSLSRRPGEMDVADIYPNPASGRVNLPFELSKTLGVRGELLDVTGRIVRVLFSDTFPPGRQTRALDVSDLSPGMYAFRVQSRLTSQTRTFVVVR